jgi:hypothetical protein
VVDEKAPADPRAGMYLDARQKSGYLGDKTRKKRNIRFVQTMRHAVHQYRVKPRVAEYDFKPALRRWVLAKDGFELFLNDGKHMC